MTWRRELSVALAILGLVSFGAWMGLAHLHRVHDEVSLRTYLLVRLGWLRFPAEDELRSALSKASSSGDLHLCVATLDWASRHLGTPEDRAASIFLAGCCAVDAGNVEDALELWSRAMRQEPYTRAASWSRRAVELMLNQSRRSWVL